ncbi:MAG: hypothetical protein ACUVQD_03020 [Thermaceae bacterium]
MGGFAKGPYLPTPEGEGFARVLGVEEGRLVLLADPKQEAFRLRKYGLKPLDLGKALLLFDPGGNPVLVRDGTGKEAGGVSQNQGS